MQNDTKQPSIWRQKYTIFESRIWESVTLFPRSRRYGALYSTVKATKTLGKAFDALVKHFTPKGRYCVPYRAIILRTDAGRGYFRCCKWCENEGLACMCKEKFISQKISRHQPSFCGDKWQADSSMHARSSAVIQTVYIHCPKNEE